MRRRALAPPSPLPVPGSGGGDCGQGATLNCRGLTRGDAGGRRDLRAGTAAWTPFRVEAGGTLRSGRGGPFSRRLTCGARRWFRNWELHVTRAGLTGLPERESDRPGAARKPPLPFLPQPAPPGDPDSRGPSAVSGGGGELNSIPRGRPVALISPKPRLENNSITCCFECRHGRNRKMFLILDANLTFLFKYPVAQFMV